MALGRGHNPEFNSVHSSDEASPVSNRTLGPGVIVRINRPSFRRLIVNPPRSDSAEPQNSPDVSIKPPAMVTRPMQAPKPSGIAGAAVVPPPALPQPARYRMLNIRRLSLACVTADSRAVHPWTVSAVAFGRVGGLLPRRSHFECGRRRDNQCPPQQGSPSETLIDKGLRPTNPGDRDASATPTDEHTVTDDQTTLPEDAFEQGLESANRPAVGRETGLKAKEVQIRM